MATLYLGETEFIGREVLAALRGAGHTVDSAPGPSYLQQDVAGRYDLVVDGASRCAQDLRLALQAVCPNRIEHRVHYVLLSSYLVYPATLRNRPVRPDELNLLADLSLAGLPQEVAGPRAVERELHLLSQGTLRYTILRPAIVEGPHDPVGRAAWFVGRILDGGLLILPDGKLPIFRHVSAGDLGQAVRAVALQERAFGQTLHVVSQGMFNYWGYAAMLRDGLGVHLTFRQVPAARWRAAGLTLPMGERASASFIDHSPLLAELGWKPTEEGDFMLPLARQVQAQQRVLDRAARLRECQVLAETEAEGGLVRGFVPQPGPRQQTPHWRLWAVPGQPASLSFTPLGLPGTVPAPALRTRRLALGDAEAALLRGALQVASAPLTIGHNALLEVLQAEKGGPRPGALCIPCSRLPCSQPGCSFCSHREPRVLGLDCDGYGWGICHTPSTHLIEIAPALRGVALLADPLACLIQALAVPLVAGAGPVWICGRPVEAALAAWLALDAQREVVHVDNLPLQHHSFPVLAVREALEAVRRGERPAPTMVVELSGHTTAWGPLRDALAHGPGGAMWAWRRPAGAYGAVDYHPIPVAAPDRDTLELALAQLQRWLSYRDVAALVGPAIPLEAYWDVLLAPPFQQPYLTADSAQHSGAPFIDSAQHSGAPFIDSAQHSGAPFIDSPQRSGAPSIEEEARARAGSST